MNAEQMDELESLRTQKAELLEALKTAVDLVVSEYCSHADKHSSDNNCCYAQDLLKAISKAEKEPRQ
jgi:hypothetical protein